MKKLLAALIIIPTVAIGLCWKTADVYHKQVAKLQANLPENTEITLIERKQSFFTSEESWLMKFTVNDDFVMEMQLTSSMIFFPGWIQSDGVIHFAAQIDGEYYNPHDLYGLAPIPVKGFTTWRSAHSSLSYPDQMFSENGQNLAIRGIALGSTYYFSDKGFDFQGKLASLTASDANGVGFSIEGVEFDSSNEGQLPNTSGKSKFSVTQFNADGLSAKNLVVQQSAKLNPDLFDVETKISADSIGTDDARSVQDSTLHFSLKNIDGQAILDALDILNKIADDSIQPETLLSAPEIVERLLMRSPGIDLKELSFDVPLLAYKDHLDGYVKLNGSHIEKGFIYSLMDNPDAVKQFFNQALEVRIESKNITRQQMQMLRIPDQFSRDVGQVFAIKDGGIYVNENLMSPFSL